MNIPFINILGEAKYVPRNLLGNDLVTTTFIQLSHTAFPAQTPI